MRFYDDAFPASQTSYCRINSHDTVMSILLEVTRSAPGVWKLGQENHVGDTFFCSQDFVVLLWM